MLRAHRVRFSQDTHFCTIGENTQFNNWMGGGNGIKKEPAAGTTPTNTDGNPNNGGNNSGNNSGDNNNPNTQNNSGTNDAIIDTIWQDAKDAADGNKGGQGGGNNQQQQPIGAPAVAADPQKEVDTYLDKMGLTRRTLSETEVQALQTTEGMQGFLDDINNRIRTAHIKAVSAANTLIDQKVAAALQKAQDSSKSFYQGEQLRGLLAEKLPFTKDPAIAPVAESVLRRFLEKGATWSEGIENTRKYFVHMQKKMDPNYVEPNGNTRQGFRGQAPQEGTADNSDWLTLLKGH